MKLEVKLDQIMEKKTDSRGRITLGKEYADQEVEIAVLSDENEHDSIEKEKAKAQLEAITEIAEKAGIELEDLDDL